MAEVPVDSCLLFDNADHFSRISPVHESNLLRSFRLRIKEEGGLFRLLATSNDPQYFDADDDWEAWTPHSRGSLWGLAQECRSVWHGAVYTPELLKCVDQSASMLWIDKTVLPALAMAGVQLFEEFFYPPDRERRFTRLNAIGDEIRRSVSQPGLAIRIISDACYAPWNLMYAADLRDRATGAGAKMEGFWGFQHLIEHTPNHYPPIQDYAKDDPFRVSLQMDERIDSTMGIPCNQAVRDCLQSYPTTRLSLSERDDFGALAQAMAGEPLSDHLLYFCCHAEVDGDSTDLNTDRGRLRLSDGAEISASQIRYWTRGQPFVNNPLVFLNACGSAQMNSVFYRGFVEAFLNSAASGVLGAQAEVPAVFASAFAVRFLQRFLSEAAPVGSILYDLRREFYKEHGNPLGLLYSLFRGTDIRLARPILAGS